MTALAPGLYKATVRCVPDQVVTLVSKTANACNWVSITPKGGAIWCTDSEITNPRPLIVLDFNQRLIEDLVQAIQEVDRSPVLTDYQGVILRTLADDLAEQTKPARIEEPGLWGVVRASYAGVSCKWVHDETDLWRTAAGCAVGWTQLIDPTLIRDGVKS